MNLVSLLPFVPHRSSRALAGALAAVSLLAACLIAPAVARGQAPPAGSDPNESATIFYPHSGRSERVPVSDFAHLRKLPRPAARAGNVVWNFTYQDVILSNGIGFDGPSGATARATIDAVAAYLSSILEHTATVDFHWNASQTDATGALASAGPFLTGVSAGFNGGDLFTHIVTGVDPNGGTPDAQGTVDFGYDWHLDHTIPAVFPQFDFFSVALHEITHALGFMALTNASGASQIGGDVRAIYERHMETATRDLFANAGAGQFLGIASDLTGGDGGVFFKGPITLAAYASGSRLHAPGTFVPGSSLAHTDVSIAASPMNAAIGAGANKRVFTDPDLRILADLGYTITPLLPNAVRDWRFYE